MTRIQETIGFFGRWLPHPDFGGNEIGDGGDLIAVVDAKILPARSRNASGREINVYAS